MIRRHEPRARRRAVHLSFDGEEPADVHAPAMQPPRLQFSFPGCPWKDAEPIFAPRDEDDDEKAGAAEERAERAADAHRAAHRMPRRHRFATGGWVHAHQPAIFRYSK